jgi:hypothetical protein
VRPAQPLGLRPGGVAVPGRPIPHAAGPERHPERHLPQTRNNAVLAHANRAADPGQAIVRMPPTPHRVSSACRDISGLMERARGTAAIEFESRRVRQPGGQHGPRFLSDQLWFPKVRPAKRHSNIQPPKRQYRRWRCPCSPIGGTDLHVSAVDQSPTDGAESSRPRDASDFAQQMSGWRSPPPCAGFPESANLCWTHSPNHARAPGIRTAPTLRSAPSG